MRQLVLSVVAVLAIASAAGCGSEGGTQVWEDRSMEGFSDCRGHGGVSAVDDDVVICTDQTSTSDRGRHAVDACRGHGGVGAFDDDFVICRDQSFHEAAGG